VQRWILTYDTGTKNNERAKVLPKFLRTKNATLLLPVGYPYTQRKSFVKKVNKENADKMYYRQL
jgi:hypothetical protein